MRKIKSKRFIALLSALLLTFCCAACNNTQAAGVCIPDITGTDINTAKNLLSANKLIPVVAEEYSDVEAGSVIRTNPNVGSTVDENSKVTIVVSKGPRRIDSKNSYGHWQYISYAEDKWEFYTPYIEDGTLYIEATITFAIATTWQDSYEKGIGGGVASINDTFDKTVPVSVQYDKQSHNAGEEQSITIEIPTTDLDVQKPTTIYLQLYLDNGGQSVKTVECDFSMTW